jgi:hypothetical protein
MTPDEFKKLWLAEKDELVTFDASRVTSLRIPEDSKSFLNSPGIPREASPFLSFGSKDDQLLQTVSKVWGQPETFERYRIIGSDGIGDPICIDEEANGRIVYLNHDNEFLVGFMNSSIQQFAYSALLFRDVVKKTRATAGSDAFLNGQIPPAIVDEFISQLDQIDPSGIKDGTFWFNSILGEGI